ncbi:MAG: N-acetylneuraminate synthase family protein [Chloroflexi bacterium]|nr:N-acetylneuraminate synthase family protein [Chloroflexota bacterium]MCI0851380.1 N-acetylneuraminate synthase family protein [Chloroflexota bacterium]MCI0871670.1 N-acetylneuraminate synthase family protein [Chloroflexota bacterium]
MASTFKIGNTEIGPGLPVYIVGEIGINHNGDIEIVKKLVDVAAETGLNAVKFQKRTPELCVPRDQWDIERDTPWGVMKYIDYRHKVEFNQSEYQEISDYCAAKGVDWFASPWDEEAVDFLEGFDVPCYKIASASVTDIPLLEKIRSTGRPVIMSSGMSTMDEIRAGVDALGRENLLICHSTSAYPCDPTELNLRMIGTLAEEFGVPIGYSGHETGLSTTVAATVLGACLVERHITLDRAMWGSDQSASVEPQGVARLVRDIRVVESALGDGVKKVYDSELGVMQKLRRAPSR